MAQTETQATTGIWPEIWQSLLNLLIANAPIFIKWMADTIASWFKHYTPAVTFQVVGEQTPVPGMTTLTLTSDPVNMLVVSVNGTPVQTVQFVQPVSPVS